MKELYISYKPKDFNKNTSCEWFLSENVRYQSKRAYKKEKYDSNRLRRVLCAALRQYKATGKDMKLRRYGYTTSQLVRHLEERFKDGMSWSNHAVKGWHIDHIKPLRSFALPKQEREAQALTNLQPLWARENLCKH